MANYDTNLPKKLEGVGLSEKEAQVYAALLELGGGYPSKIAQTAHLNRTTVYKILTSLSIRGLVSEVEKRNKLFYQVEEPKSLARYASSQITIAERQLDEAKRLLPSLEGLYSLSPNKPVVKFFEGQEGALAVYQTHVDVSDKYEMLSVSNTGDLLNFLPEKFRNDYIKKKEKLGITTRAILPDTELDTKYSETIYAKFDKKIWPKLRHVSKDKFPFKSDMTIYDKNKVSFVNFNEPQFAGTIIEDQVIHDMMVMIFELAWQSAKDAITN